MTDYGSLKDNIAKTLEKLAANNQLNNYLSHIDYGRLLNPTQWDMDQHVVAIITALYMAMLVEEQRNIATTIKTIAEQQRDISKKINESVDESTVLTKTIKKLTWAMLLLTGLAVLAAIASIVIAVIALNRPYIERGDIKRQCPARMEINSYGAPSAFFLLTYNCLFCSIDGVFPFRQTVHNAIDDAGSCSFQENAPKNAKGLKARLISRADDGSGLQPCDVWRNREPGALPQATMVRAVGAEMTCGRDSRFGKTTPESNQTWARAGNSGRPL
jgi:hypothetical protein